MRDIYCAQLHSDVELLNDVINHLLQRNGKMIRPMLLLLAAGTRSEALVSDTKMLSLAAAMEMLHNSSLIHDDVVDNDSSRRGATTVNYQWNNQIAVLVGDFYLAQLMNLLHKVNDVEVSMMVNDTVVKMSEGELIQQEVLRNGHITSEAYQEIIRRKTAVLMATCCAIGNPQLKTFGEHFGMAFQLRDDLNDHDARPETEQLLQQAIASAQQCLAPLPASIYKTNLQNLLNTLS